MVRDPRSRQTVHLGVVRVNVLTLTSLSPMFGLSNPLLTIAGKAPSSSSGLPWWDVEREIRGKTPEGSWA